MAKAFPNPTRVRAEIHDQLTGENTASIFDRWASRAEDGRTFTHPSKTGAEKLTAAELTGPGVQAARITAALQALYGGDVRDVSYLLTNGLADLRHLCDAQGLDFAAHDRNGYQAYLAERSNG